jgi:predicted nucleotidyltransferase
MSQELSAVAERLGCSERTLRRYANEGLLRARRMTRHRLELPFAEESYLTSHWELLNGLRMALRTERAVRLAVLFGSTAVGDDGDSSDVDLLVVHRNPKPLVLAGLKMRLRRALERPVDIVELQQAEAMPTLLADILSEGRVVVDRDESWEGLLTRRRAVSVAAEREALATATRARQAVVGARERIEMLRDEARQLSTDPVDRAELAELRHELDALAPAWPAV